MEVVYEVGNSPGVSSGIPSLTSFTESGVVNTLLILLTTTVPVSVQREKSVVLIFRAKVRSLACRKRGGLSAPSAIEPGYCQHIEQGRAPEGTFTSKVFKKNIGWGHASIVRGEGLLPVLIDI